MSKEVSEWQLNAPDNNFDPADGGWPELMDRDEVNDAARENMRAVRNWYDDPEWLDLVRGATFSRVTATQFTLFLTGVDLSGYFETGRLLQIADGGGAGVALQTQVASASYNGTNTTTVNIAISDAMDVASSGVRLFFAASVRRLALLDNDDVFYRPATNDSAGIQAAVNAADAAGGGIVFLSSASYVMTATVTVPTVVDILGAGNGAKLVRSADFSPVLAVGTNCRIANVQFDLDYATYNATAGVAVDVSGAGRVTVEGCRFTGVGEGAIADLGVATDQLVVRGCTFAMSATTSASAAAVRMTADGSNGVVTASHVTIPGAGTDGAAIDLAGEWIVSACRIAGLNGASTQAVGIRLRDASAEGTGGRRSAITGCKIHAIGSLAYGIYAGGDYSAISGNSLQADAIAGSVGILLTSISGGFQVESVTVSGNSIRGFGTGVSLTNRTLRCAVSGNSITNCSNGVSVRGDENVASANVLSGQGAGTGSGVVLDANSRKCAAINNLFRDFFNGVSIVAGSEDAVAWGNVVVNCTNDFQSSSSALRDRVWLNQDQARLKALELVANQAVAVSAETNITEFSGQALPGAGVGNANRKFRVRARIMVLNFGGPNDFRVRFYTGTTGGAGGSDTLVKTNLVSSLGTSADAAFHFNFEFTAPAGADKWGFSMQCASANYQLQVNVANHGAGSYAEIEQVTP